MCQGMVHRNSPQVARNNHRSHVNLDFVRHITASMLVKLASEISLQLIDRETLVVDDALDQIANRDDAHDSFILNDGKMPHAFFRHECHARIHRIVWFDARKTR